MFSSPLAHAADEYLQTTDASVRERTRQQLVSAGASAIEPLVGALIKTLREGKSRSLGRKEMNHFIDELGRQGVFDEDHLKVLRQQTRGIPDRKDGGYLRRRRCTRKTRAVTHDKSSRRSASRESVSCSASSMGEKSE
jgi:hypothetical protein